VPIAIIGATTLNFRHPEGRIKPWLHKPAANGLTTSS
jgi:hypothetical protein